MVDTGVHIHNNILSGGMRLLDKRMIVEFLDEGDYVETSTVGVGRVLGGMWNGSVIYFRKSNDIINLSTLGGK
jgi:hypothetical protein